MGSRISKPLGITGRQFVQVNWWFLLAIVAARQRMLRFIPRLCDGGHALGRAYLAQMIRNSRPDTCSSARGALGNEMQRGELDGHPEAFRDLSDTDVPSLLFKYRRHD